MSLYKPPNSDNWYISISHQGRRIRESTQTPDRKAAQEYHDKVKAGLWREKLGERYITFGDACAVWLKAGERGKTDRYGVRYLLNEVGAGNELRGVTPELVESVLSEKSPSTKRRYINLVSAICRLSGHNPNLKRPADSKKIVRWLTKAEWKRLQVSLELIAPHLLNPARIAIGTGLRASNVLDLEWSRVDLKRKAAFVESDESKSGELIPIPLSVSAIRILKQQEGMDERYVFPYHPDGQPVTRASNHGWKSAKEHAKVKSFRWHDFRHTWATWHVMGGTPLEVLMKLGGWHSMDQVLIYAHFAPDFLKKFANNAKPK